MRVYRRNMHQAATLYRRTGLTMYGEPEFDTGATIRCRWQTDQKLFLDAQGEQFVSQAVVYPATKVHLGDRLALGASAPLADAKEVRFSGESPSLDARMKLYKVALS